MKYFKFEINAERFAKANAMEYDERKWEFCSASEIYGYGVYGLSLKEENGKYFVSYSIGDSCD